MVMEKHFQLSKKLSVPAEEVSLKKKAGGGLGGRAQRLPPRCIGPLCICCFLPSAEFS